MVFSSNIFLFFFLPLTLLLYYLCPRRFRNALLLAASLLFYAWGEPVYLSLMVFTILLNYLSGRLLGKPEQRPGRRKTVLVLALVRIVLCLFPQNNWIQNSSDLTWGIIRNVPFVFLGAVICWLYYGKRAERNPLRPMWIYILLSFLFYMPVAVAAGILPILGMLMLPKTVCYILMICAFLRVVRSNA